MPNEPLAYFLTWTTYGSWLHGDSRGSVDPQHNEPGTPALLRDDRRTNYERRRLMGEPVLIDGAMRPVLERAIQQTCSAAEETAPERVLTAFKAWGTRYLREAGHIVTGHEFWTRHGSTRYLWTDDDVAAARSYVLFHQGGDLPGATYSPPDFSP